MDRSLKGVTHVIVDEIHERGMNEGSDIIVLFECYFILFNMIVWCLPLAFVRFSSHCPEGSSPSSSWFEVNFDECNLKCWAFFFLLWWCANYAYPCKLRILISISVKSSISAILIYFIIPLYFSTHNICFDVIHSLTCQWSVIFCFYGHGEFSVLIMIV